MADMPSRLDALEAACPRGKVGRPARVGIAPAASSQEPGASSSQRQPAAASSSQQQQQLQQLRQPAAAAAGSSRQQRAGWQRPAAAGSSQPASQPASRPASQPASQQTVSLFNARESWQDATRNTAGCERICGGQNDDECCPLCVRPHAFLIGIVNIAMTNN